MLQHRITRSITCLVAIVLLAWSPPVAAYDIGDDGFRLTSQERGNTSVAAKDAEKGTTQPHLPFELSPYDRWIGAPQETVTVARADDVEKRTFQLHLPFELSPYDRWNTSVVTFDSEGSTYGLPPDEALTVTPWNSSRVAYISEGSYPADEAEDSIPRYDLPPEDILSIVAFDAEDTTYDGGLRREDMLAVARAQILAENVNRIAARVFYNAGSAVILKRDSSGVASAVVVINPAAFHDDACESC